MNCLLGKTACSFILAYVLALAALAKNPPHIVLVMADDHGYGDCGFTGHPFVRTPNLDQMAKSGVVFNRFYASAPVCSPTRASVMTGRHPFRTNVPNHGHYMRPDERTIAEQLGKAGCQARAISRPPRSTSRAREAPHGWTISFS